MRILHKTFAPVALLLLAGGAVGAAPDLAKRVAQQDGWVTYQVPKTADGGIACCFEFHGRHAAQAGCDLDGHNWSTGISDDHRPMQASDALDVYLHVNHGQVDKVRAFSASCPVRDADKVRRLDDVSPQASVAFLAASTATTTSEEIADAELAALAMHADAGATTALRDLSGPSHAHKVREQALFWLGQERGADGAQIVEHAATTDGDPELRAHAVFVLSEAHGVDGYAAIQRIAQSDPSDHVREQALFWMAQTGDARAKDDITAAIGRETSKGVREQAVFALSQLKDHEADAALIALVRGNYPREVKQQALFWLGQSGSTEAIKFLDDVLSRQAAKSVGG
jgi:HEAT repeat protein